jgi:hypothetical protein
MDFFDGEQPVSIRVGVCVCKGVFGQASGVTSSPFFFDFICYTITIEVVTLFPGAEQAAT